MSFRLRVVSYIEKTVLTKRNDTFQSTSNKPRRFFRKSRRRNRPEERFNCSCFYLLSASPFFFFLKMVFDRQNLFSCEMLLLRFHIYTFFRSLLKSAPSVTSHVRQFIKAARMLYQRWRQKEKCCNAWINCRIFQKTQCYSI